MAWHVSSALLSSAGMEFLFFLSIILYYFGYGKDKSFFARLWWTDFNVSSRKEYTKSQTRLWKKFYREFPLRKFCFAGRNPRQLLTFQSFYFFYEGLSAWKVNLAVVLISVDPFTRFSVSYTRIKETDILWTRVKSDT